MNRRVFVKLGIFGAGALSIPMFHCSSGDQFSISLKHASFLSQICDEQALKEIGNAYRVLKPDEGRQEQLVNELMTGIDGKRIDKSSSDEELDKLLEQKIVSDFEKGKTVTVKGWILSETEARQCALLSFSLNKQ